MEIKKSDKADLERKKPVYVQIGLVLALSIMLFGFEYKSYDKVVVDEAIVTQKDVIEEVVLQTKQEAKPEPPPPAQSQTTLLNIVDNNVTVTNDLEIDAADDNKENKEYQQVEQEATTDAVEAEIFSVVEDNPIFPGGDEGRMKFLSENLKYPQMARESNIDGTVYIEFIVEKDGSISKPTIKRDIGGGCGDEALRVARSMPKWTPGKQRGKPVRTQFVMPIKFVLN
ncbi:MAG: energy transducer TonB [Bacteroidota bacterium]